MIDGVSVQPLENWQYQGYGYQPGVKESTINLNLEQKDMKKLNEIILFYTDKFDLSKFETQGLAKEVLRVLIREKKYDISAVTNYDEA